MTLAFDLCTSMWYSAALLDKLHEHDHFISSGNFFTCSISCLATFFASSREIVVATFLPVHQMARYAQDQGALDPTLDPAWLALAEVHTELEVRPARNDAGGIIGYWFRVKSSVLLSCILYFLEGFDTDRVYRLFLKCLHSKQDSKDSSTPYSRNVLMRSRQPMPVRSYISAIPRGLFENTPFPISTEQYAPQDLVRTLKRLAIASSVGIVSSVGFVRRRALTRRRVCTNCFTRRCCTTDRR